MPKKQTYMTCEEPPNELDSDPYISPMQISRSSTGTLNPQTFFSRTTAELRWLTLDLRSWLRLTPPMSLLKSKEQQGTLTQSISEHTSSLRRVMSTPSECC